VRKVLFVTIVALLTLTACNNRNSINASFYPNGSDLTISFEFKDVGSVENCRAVVKEAARLARNPSMEGADYECCVNPTGEMVGDVTVCKETVR
jgi:uncharacterized lipoprotein NlpE involved in copper resistance